MIYKASSEEPYHLLLPGESSIYFVAFNLIMMHVSTAMFCLYKNLSFILITALTDLSFRSLPTGFVRLDQDILSPLAGKKQLYTYETTEFWEQIKTPG